MAGAVSAPEEVRLGLVAKRRVRESWRDAVERRARSAAPADEVSVLAAYDASLRDGASEAEAAYGALERHGLLWEVTAPGLDPVERPAVSAERS